jgi:hypothetical protein
MQSVIRTQLTLFGTTIGAEYSCYSCRGGVVLRQFISEFGWFAWAPCGIVCVIAKQTFSSATISVYI